MKNKFTKPTRSHFNILRQICNFIPAHTVSKIARETGVEKQARRFHPAGTGAGAPAMTPTINAVKAWANGMAWGLVKSQGRCLSTSGAEARWTSSFIALIPVFII